MAINQYKAGDSDFTLPLRTPKTGRRWLQISLRWFLIIVFLSATLLGLWGRRVRESMEQKQYFPKVYNFATLVLKPDSELANFDALIAEVKTIEPKTWGRSSGSIEAFPTNLSVVVDQTKEMHEKIERLLEKKRRRLARLPVR